MKNVFILLFLLINFISFSLTNNYYIAIKGNLNVRLEPSKTAKIISKIKENHLFFVIIKTEVKENINNIENYWYKIKTLENIEGYVFGEYIKNVDLSDKIPNLEPNMFEIFKLEGDNYIEKRENLLLGKYPKNKRVNNVLYLNLSNDKLKEIKNNDNPENEVEYTVYYLLNYYENINYYLLYVGYYEWLGFILVNGNNGKEYKLKDVPVFNADYTKCICSFNYDERYLTGINVEILKIDVENIIAEANFEIENDLVYCLTNPRWIKLNLIQLDRINIIYDNGSSLNGKPLYFISQSEIEYVNNKWILNQ